MAKHQFQMGNNYSRGGIKGNKGGRPTKAVAEKKRQDAEIKRLAGIMAKKQLEEYLGTVLGTYASLATGRRIGNILRKLDPATCRHFVERFVGQAPRTITLDLEDSIETFFEKVANRQRQWAGKRAGGAI